MVRDNEKGGRAKEAVEEEMQRRRCTREDATMRESKEREKSNSGKKKGKNNSFCEKIKQI